MVKNSTGGNKSKAIARKTQAPHAHGHIRIAEETGEVYAQTIKVMGGNIIQAVDLEGNTLQVHIRGKFRGRRKRSNFIGPDTWLLVGLREWVHQSEKKICVCDVLEVYSESDKSRLMKTDLKVDWSVFTSRNSSNALIDDNDVEFLDETAIEYETLLNAAGADGKAPLSLVDEEGDICVDDI